LSSGLAPPSPPPPPPLTHYNDRMTLVLEDPGGVPLDRLLGRPLEVSHFLRIAIPLAKVLRQVHERGLIHKDIKPANVLVDAASGGVWLTGFGIASSLPREHQTPAPPEVIAGTLAYMAPEQTGRMNRSVDSRSDLYALGVTFYEMLTGTLPFTAADPMEWVHCHIARQPVPPNERVVGIPGPLSAIVMKLLAKTGEERYQTSTGVEADLRRGLAEWESHGRIDSFRLGADDASDRLLIPEKLYGREREIDTLLASFDRVVANGTLELVLVSGYAGIGKSSVVNELHKALVPPRGLFASGKFDQYKRDIPYATLGQAFQSLVRSLLTQSEEELGRWRESLSEALGPNGQLIVNLVPELELVIAKQPPVADLPPQDAQNRFQMVFRRFLGAFARPEHPLALFLDDLQWLDTASLDLLEHLVTHSEMRHLLLVGAYRDNEISPSHPLLRTLEAIRKAGARVQEIVLAPLELDDVGRLIAGALHCELERARLLAELVQEKTGGNPFFAIQFFTALADEGLLAFDPAASAWQWNIDRIRAKSYTDNVVDLMAEKLKRLSATTQEALNQLACLGNVAEVATLALVHGTTEEAMHTALSEAVHAGFIFCQDGAYKFLHDRIQQAAHSLIPEEHRAEIHLRIGRMLLSRLPEEAVRERVFEVVNQLNRGAAFITDPSEQEKLKQLNALAGRRAKNAIAYASARSYLTQATAWLRPDAWTAQYEDTFALLIERCECEYLTGNFQAAEELSAAILENARSDVDRAQVYRLRLRLSESGGRYDDALFVMRDALRLFGMTLPESDQAIHAATEAEAREIAINLRGRRVADLADAPAATDPIAEMIISVIAESLSQDYVTVQWLPFLAATGVNICLRHGNTAESAIVYNGYARVLVCAGYFQSAFEFSEMALRLAAKFDNRRLETLVLERHAFFVNHWRHHVATSLQHIDQCFDAYVKLGDFYAGYTGFHLVELSIERGCPLDDLLKTCRKYADFAAQSYNDALLDTFRVQQQFIACLTGRTRELTSIDGGGFQAERLAALAVRRYHVLKQQLLFHFGRYDEALESAERAAPALRWRDDLLLCATYHFYRALTLAAVYPRVAGARRQEFRRILGEELLRHRGWADSCPENFDNRHALLAAEVARIDGEDLEAMRCYEQAIRSAREHGFVQNEGLAHELAARFYAERGFDTIAHAYLREARRCYLRWGAFGKVRQLERLHPHLRDAPVPASPTTTIGAPVEQLDVGTVLKAAQAVSGEILLGELIKTLLRITVEHAGAERGLLILFAGDEPRIAAEATTGRGQVEVTLRQTAVSPAELPVSVLHYVIRTRESVILDDALAQNPFSADEYIDQKCARSVLCLPLVKQSKLIGVLYLENNLASRAFTPTRISVLELLASQAAISLENARLYNDLGEREARIRRLVDSNIIGIVIWDVHGRIIDANEAFFGMLGYSHEDLVSGRLRWRELTPAEWRDADDRAIAELRATGTTQPREKEYFRKDGSRVPVLVGRAIFEGRRDEGVAFVLDLTERKRAEYLARQVFESSPDRISIVGRDHRFQRVNPAFERRWGMPAETFIGKHVADFLGTEGFEQTAKAYYDRCFAGEEVGYAEWFNLSIGRRYLAVTYSPLRPDSERVEAVLAISRDLTEHVLASEALREAQAELAHVTRVTTLGEMAASIAHEVNQPLAAVVANAEACLSWLDRATPDLDAARRSVEWIIDDGNRAGEVIRRVRALANKTDIEKAPLDINDVVKEAIALLQGELVSHRVSLRIEFAPALTMVPADRVQLQQVMINLVMNGIEAMQSVTDRPRELLIRSLQDETQQVLVSVTDCGVGISAENADRLFNAFFTTKASGMGMGLSICRSIVEAHGGRLWATANLPHGATFYFTLPVNADNAS
jgi:PAS domain S-box-containing protein